MYFQPKARELPTKLLIHLSHSLMASHLLPQVESVNKKRFESKKIVNQMR